MMKRLFAMVFCAIVCAAATAADFDLPEPVPTPKGPPHVPEGEKQFMIWHDIIPGVRIVSMRLNGKLWHYATTQSVGDGAGMYIYVPPGEKIGNLCANDTGVIKRGERDDYKEFKGISLWIKGDGSDAKALLGWGYTASGGPKFRISLKDKKWHKVHIPWDKWTPPFDTSKIQWLINFGLERTEHTKANWYIVDRVHYYKEATTEKITPTPNADPACNLPAKAFAKGRDHIKKTLAKLKAKEKVTIVLAGDSIACGAQLGFLNPSWQPEFSSHNRKYWFWVVAAERMAEHFGYDGVSLVHRTPDKDGAWKDIPFSDGGKDLTVIAVAKSGYQTKSMMPHLDRVLKEKPDLVLWALGANDFVYGNLATYTKCTREAIAKFKAAGAEVILHTPTPGADRQPWAHLLRSKAKLHQDRGFEFAARAREIAGELGCAVADMHGAMTARGVIFLGDLYCDMAHPNHIGHEMMADVLDALVTDRDVRIWRHVPKELLKGE